MGQSQVTITYEACLGYFGIRDIGPFYLGIFVILILGYGIFTYCFWDMGY